ncbi:DUF72 domain-containing protein [Deinococcus wulumuqiensis]|uniref:DUF72 domain-containing protein n=1 Tax=Deinococcus wulumuqiensis TaxID=980427 RepID=A0AAV4K7J1_9DEIO|nr:DUF72 domain-containing protein [Deinococcus wulumuqiensis]QII19323.1 DUF72 domain-containing protein [Deinococcus wulumuqiensis R12]GGI91123.1 hypothetical protein GCM10010914_26880 [Deinococcus wulumuqiensis]GGP31113.1 hypothetical protein GCM10008021_27640 [Deinococcus wulumuqiensis]
MTVFVGTAGWGLSREQQALFGPGGSLLERYATRLSAAEINSSFYRPHRRSTYQKWAASVPEDFRFSVKVPKAVTHTAKLRECAGLLADFMEGVNGLGDKLGGLLVQLPPSLKYEPDVAADFFAALRQETPVPAVCEPRHATWFGGEADALLRQFHIGRVAADPARVPEAAGPGGFTGTVYYRWHGSPRMYYSAYSEAQLAQLAEQVRAQAGDVWVIFDNTASGAGVENTLRLRERLTPAP